jgi:hypothetical protein
MKENNGGHMSNAGEQLEISCRIKRSIRYWESTDISEEVFASIFTVEEKDKH